MEFDGVNSIVCDAEEADWLDVSYSERKYVADQTPAKKKAKIRFKNANGVKKIGKPLRIVAIALLCVAVLAAMLFVDGNFGKDVFQTAKAAYSSVLSIFDKAEPQDVSATIAIPSNHNLVDINDGVATFEGGRATLSFTAGKVIDATESSVTVAIDDETAITYENLTTVFVNIGDTVSAGSLLGKYDGTFTATITQSGETVKDVIGSETQLTWNV
ncbi:MAG: hypothetical protein J1F66_05665 [Clostridiales bacterium]|nr:hypothetical protein [Clostridiales bacterium]